MRDRSVVELQKRFDVDLVQAQRVARSALWLYDQICATSEPADELRRELGWAAVLHEMGMLVSHHDHHRHSAYLLAHVDAAGFSQSQQRRLGALVLGQRGGLRKCEMALTDPVFARQLLCLRLAVIACHRRDDPDMQGWRLRVRNGTAELDVDGQSTPDPRTQYLLREEATRWERSPSVSFRLRALANGNSAALTACQVNAR